MSEINSKRHTLMLDNRGKLIITGAQDVGGFNETAVSILTTAGMLVIRGEDLHIGKLNLETGDVCVDGKITLMQYVGGEASKSRFSKLFR